MRIKPQPAKIKLQPMKIKLLLLFVLLLAGFLRFYRLGAVPISPDWDEAALGYNAYSIMQTGKDEFGKTLRLSCLV